MSDFITKVIFEWGVRAFGSEHMRDKRIRALRLLEEATELAQVCDVPREKAHDLIEAVYSRPVGIMAQEIGGVFVTAHAFCAGQVLYPDKVLEDEVCRVLSKSPEFFAERNKEKLDMGLK